MSGISRLASPSGWTVRARLVRAVLAWVGCLGHEACFAGVFLDYGDVAVSDDDCFGLWNFVAGLDQESVGVSSHAAVQGGVDREGCLAGGGAAFAHDGELGKITAALSGPVDPLVDLAERCLVERDLHKPLPVLVIGFSHPRGVPWRSGFKTDASTVVRGAECQTLGIGTGPDQTERGAFLV